MAPAVLFGILSLVGTVISGVANAISTSRTNKQNREFQEDINQQNIDNQWKMWNANNAYNNPSAQMDRYRDAGLNPNLIYGQSNTASPVNVGVASSASSIAPNFDFIANAIPQLFEVLNSRQNLKNSEVSNNLIMEQYLGMVTRNQFESEDMQNKLNLSSWEAKKLEKEIELIGKQIQIGEYDVAIKELEKIHQQYNIDYEKKLHDKGLDPDLDPKLKMLANLIGNLVEFISGGKLKADTIFGWLFN